MGIEKIDLRCIAENRKFIQLNYDINNYSKSYTCAFCGNNVASENLIIDTEVEYAQHSPLISSKIDKLKLLKCKNGGFYTHYLAFCPHCGKPTYFEYDNQFPGVLYGEYIRNLPVNIENHYHEVRKCFSINAFTSATLICRKILLLIAINEGIESKKPINFVECLNWLEEKNFIGANSKPKFDTVRTIGNDATHEIDPASEQNAIEALELVQLLLMNIYKFKKE